MRKTFLTVFMLVLAIGLAVPTLAQIGPTPPGLFINWTIKLAPMTAGETAGTSRYVMYKEALNGKSQLRFSVECEYVEYAEGTMMDVFLKGPRGAFNEPPIWVGSMEVRSHSAALLLVTANTPNITKGTQVLVKTREGLLIMAGHF